MDFRKESGTVIVEACFCLLPTLFVVVLNLELARRATLEIGLHYGVFQWVRNRALGLSERESKRRVARFFEEAYGGGERAHRIWRTLHWHIRRRADGRIEGKVHYRFPMLWSWPGRHHFESTRRCTFCC